MERKVTTERANWKARVEARGLVWHSADEQPYWHEGVHYEITGDEIEKIERATNELHTLCLSAVQVVIDEKRYDQLGIPPTAIPLIESSWEAEPPSLYGRFDLAYDGVSPPKMLEYNADTPTSLLEASVIQWDWMQDCFPKADQFNGIHESLISLWREFQPYLPAPGPDGHIVHFSSMDNVEDAMTSAYLAETAALAGYRVKMLAIDDLGWNDLAREFRDLDEERITTLFKLYPWEWMASEAFAAHVLPSESVIIEPAWKMILSNKGILPILWELNPDSPYLLPAYFDDPGDMFEWVKKPLLSREGANVTVHTMQDHIEGKGSYGAEGFIFQELATIPLFEGRRPVIGAWMVGQSAAGIGIRESDGWVTDNTSRFVPHIFR